MAPCRRHPGTLPRRFAMNGFVWRHTTTVFPTDDEQCGTAATQDATAFQPGGRTSLLAPAARRRAVVSRSDSVHSLPTLKGSVPGWTPENSRLCVVDVDYHRSQRSDKGDHTSWRSRLLPGLSELGRICLRLGPASVCTKAAAPGAITASLANLVPKPSCCLEKTINQSR